MVVCVLGICTSFSAKADYCTFQAGAFKTGLVNLGSIAVPTNAPIGSTIATTTASYDSIVGPQDTWCGTNVPITASFLMSGTKTGDLYETNIPGIGIRISFWSNTAGYFGTPSSPTPLAYSWGYSMGGYVHYDTTSLMVKVDLVVTGPITGSNTATLNYSVAPWYQVTGDRNTLAVSNLTVSAQLTINTCSVTTSAIAVQLPTVFPGNFNTGSAGATPFNISLNCVKGTNVNLTLTDASDVSNRSTMLSLSPDSTAAGVGLQILNGSVPIAFGPDSADIGNTNQWSVGAASGGTMSIPLTARYIRTAGPLTPGIVKGLATFTMSYQ
jgi:type 1 fimbria pilin